MSGGDACATMRPNLRITAMRRPLRSRQTRGKASAPSSANPSAWYKVGPGKSSALISTCRRVGGIVPKKPFTIGHCFNTQNDIPLNIGRKSQLFPP
jgi:hypothetical protein